MKSAEKEISLKSSITELKGVGPKKAEAFNKLGIFSFEDCLGFYPRSYQDFRNITGICDLKDGDKKPVKARVLLVNPGKGYGRKKTLHLLCEDNTGRMEVLFFMAGYMAKNFARGEEYLFFGKVKVENSRVTMFHPVYAKADDADAAGILPVYPLTTGLSQKDIRRAVEAAIDHADGLEESLPLSVIEKANLCGNTYAVRNIHFPEDEQKYKEARYRLVYEELFYLKAALTLSGNRFGKGRSGNSFKSTGASDFIKTLSYELTGAQKRVLKEVLEDMESPLAMNRLIQGDVGSGKTVIAEAALMQAVKSGFQGAFMAPTEILAAQHFASLSADLAPFGVHIDLLSSSLGAKERKQVLSRLISGDTDIVVGTHALISKDVEYAKLGLVITDEQHRFGVSQRKSLSEKGNNPDILVMTATPIPRTLAVVIYADLDVSVIDEMPPGRKTIVTQSFTSKTRKKAFEALVKEVEAGRQAYIVAPLIEDSEAMDGYSAEALFEEVSKKNPGISCRLLHGAMKQSEKDEIMTSFYNGSVSVLVSTVVIEVGINVPNASVMLIENAERFGLAQMHQLRGRVGRGSSQSYCYIITENESDVASERAEIMCSTADGFVIAEKDLEIRGPGEFFGYRQHGLPQLGLADPVKHAKLAAAAAADIKELLADDPYLAKQENRHFSEILKRKYTQPDSLTL